MSPVSRRRKPKKKTRTPQPSEPLLFDISEPCICPACTGERPAAAVIVDAFMTRARDLPLAADPLEAEMVGSMILGVPAIDRDDVDLLVVDLLIPNIEERGTAVALALLLALASVAEDEVAAPAGAAAHRLVATGIRPPRWAAELDEPVTSTEHRRLVLPDHGTVLLACEFHRGRRTQRILVTVDEVAGWIASDIALLAEPLPKALDLIAQGIRDDGGEVITEDLDAAEFRSQVEDALAARLELDLEEGLVDDEDDGEPDYDAMALVLRRRLDALPNPDTAATNADEFDATRFDTPAVNGVLARLR